MTNGATISIRGMECFVHKWNVDPTKTPKALAVVFHGFLAHGAYPTVRYAAECLAEDGYAVVAVDMPGHGKSQGARGYLESADAVIQDGEAIVNYAREIYKSDTSVKTILVGSSMGGAIALSVAQKLGTNAVAGVVLLAPMLKINVSAIEHSLLQFLAYVVPTVGMIPSSATDDAKQYRDEGKRKECAEDALTVSGAMLKCGSVLALVNITKKIHEEVENITFPYMLMIADEDVVVKNEGSEELFSKSPSKDKTKKNYPALHGLLCEPSPLVDQIKKDMLEWINERV